MALSARLELRQGQQLVMTPQLQQAIKLLQLSNIELNDFVEAELERNPLLERDDIAEAAPEPSPPEHDGDGSGEERVNGEADEPWLDLSRAPADPAATLDTDLDNVYPDASGSDLAGSFQGDQSLAGYTAVRQRLGGGDGDDVNLEAFATSEQSLRSYLSEQMALALPDAAERLIGQHLVDQIDDAGYLATDLGDLADRLGAPRSLIERVLAKAQTLDPPGVFARTLAECLALQLKEQNRYDPQIASLLANLHLLASHNVQMLRKVVGVDMDELVDMINEIKRLNPKPGLIFGAAQVQVMVPDVLVRMAADGSWIVELNSETLPRVLVNRSYFARVARPGVKDSDKGYLADCLQSANWLVKSLDQRARTILKVSEEIVRQQDGFLTHGVQHLRPLNLKTVAEAISMHESTVSRVTSNKYIATPRGLFELKYFFTSAIAASGEGEAHSSESVRFRIKQLVEGETCASVLSDDKIVDILKGDGIDIARRTVAKYREAMRIPSSVQRRRGKRLSERVRAI